MNKLVRFSLVTSFIAMLSLPGMAQEVVSTNLVAAVSKDLLSIIFGANASQLQYGIDVYRMTYTTTSVKGLPDTASGLFIMPQAGSTAVPLLVYQHGTVDSRTDVPSNLKGGWEAGAAFAAFGFATVVPDYLGLGTSKGYHPYIHAASESSAAVDMMYAARSFIAQSGFAVNDKLFVTGYSQGGHASMALHRDLEAKYSNDFPVTAAAHLSGPYNVSGEMLKLLLSDQPYGTVAYGPHVVIAYDYVYNLYDSLEQVFKAPYAAMVARRASEEIGVSELNTLLINQLVADHGAPIPRYMFQDTLVAALESNPDHPFRAALRDNDTYDWAPKVPTRIFYCKADDQVVYTNSLVAEAKMQANGAPDVLARDLDSTLNHTGCVIPALLNSAIFFSGFNTTTSNRDLDGRVEPLQVQPNPVSDVLLITALAPGAQVELYDLNGRLLRRMIATEEYLELNVQDLTPGMYLVRAIQDRKMSAARISVL